MNLTDKLIQFDNSKDTTIFSTAQDYSVSDCWGVCIELFSWLKLEHKRYMWSQEGRPTQSKPHILSPESFFTKIIPDFIANDDVFRHSLKIEGNELYYSDDMTEAEIRTITKAAFDHYNPGRSYN